METPARSVTREKRIAPISHTRAMEAATRLIHSHFRTEPHARISIPVSADDDDVVILDYIAEQIDKDAARRISSSAHVGATEKV